MNRGKGELKDYYLCLSCLLRLSLFKSHIHPNIASTTVLAHSCVVLNTSQSVHVNFERENEEVRIVGI